MNDSFKRDGYQPVPSLPFHSLPSLNEDSIVNSDKQYAFNVNYHSLL